MCKEFIDLFLYLIENKQKIISRRSNINPTKVYYLNKKEKIGQHIYKQVSILKNKLSILKKAVS